MTNTSPRITLRTFPEKASHWVAVLGALLACSMPLKAADIENRSSVMLYESVDVQNDDSLFVRETMDPDWDTKLMADVDLALFVGPGLMFGLRNVILADLNESVDNYLEELYVSVDVAQWFRLDLGKINPIGGAAMGFSPVDYFRQDLQPSYKTFGPKQRPGEWLSRIRVQHPFGEGTIIYSPKIEINDDSLDKNVTRIFADNDVNRFYAGSSFLNFGNLIPEVFAFYDGQWAFGYSATVQKNSFILWIEGSLETSAYGPTFIYPEGFDAVSYGDLSSLSYEETERELNYNQAVGFNYLFDGMHSVSLDYSYRGGGYSSSRWDSYKDSLENGYFSGDVGGVNGYQLLAKIYNPAFMGRHFLSFNARGADLFVKGLFPSSNIELLCSDMSALLTLGIEYRINDSLLIAGKYTDALGGPGTVYGEFPIDYSADLGIRFFF